MDNKNKVDLNNVGNEETSVKDSGSIKYYLKIALTLLVISAVTASLLALVNAITKDRIAANEEAVMKEALGRIFDGCDEIVPLEGEFEAPVSAVYEVYSGGKRMGFGIQSSPTGFKDVIGLIVGTDTEGNCLGVEITSISDTPGVGTKVKEGGFLSGFGGLNGESVGDYNTIAGATISSKAVKNGVSAALALDIFVADGDENVKEEESSDNNELPAESETVGEGGAV